MIEAIVIFVVCAIAYGTSWLVTAGIIKLITLCFGWSFSWAAATGVWLVLMLARWVMRAAKGDKD